jgi:hypothetical protein
MHGDKIQLYQLVRKKDRTGVSGVGIVALIAKLPSGKCVMEWITGNHPSISIFNTIEDIEIIHGHNNSTVVKSLNGPDTSKKSKRNKK